MDLSKNPNPRAIDLLKEHPKRIDWNKLSANPAAIDILKENPEKIHWYWLSENTSIFEIDYVMINKIKQKKR